jgi:hypothetical protein
MRLRTCQDFNGANPGAISKTKIKGKTATNLKLK